ncbi:MAG: PAS domain S-box protein [Helicobacteraceae bacterium]|nr:PAS domain S-box protein [Helicobacteraceae bacterium]
MDKNKVTYIAENFYWDGDLKKLFIENQEVELSVSQKRLITYMLKNANKALQNVDIFYEVYNSMDREFNEKSVRNLISALRKLIPSINIKNDYGGYYTLVTYTQENKEFKKYLFEILEQSKNAIALTDPNQFDNPIIYVNQAFLDLFGYSSEELLGNNIRLLNNGDTTQEGLTQLKKAIRAEEFIEVNIREYSKKGDLIYDEITISPILDTQREKLVYFLSVHKDITATQELLQKLQEIL